MLKTTVFILFSACTATNNCADAINEEALNTMLLRQYDCGENRYFHPDMSCRERYAAYACLCCHTPSCSCSAVYPEEGREVLESYITSQTMTCNKAEINEKNFGPHHIVMRETIKNKQKEDLNRYYQQRSELKNNPERCLVCLCPLTMCAAIPIWELRANHLRTILPSNIAVGSIQRFILEESACPCAIAGVTGVSLLYILDRIYNL